MFHWIPYGISILPSKLWICEIFFIWWVTLSIKPGQIVCLPVCSWLAASTRSHIFTHHSTLVENPSSLRKALLLQEILLLAVWLRTSQTLNSGIVSFCLGCGWGESLTTACILHHITHQKSKKTIIQHNTKVMGLVCLWIWTVNKNTYNYVYIYQFEISKHMMVKTWMIIPWRVSGEDHPYLSAMKRPFGRGPTTLLRGVLLTIVANYLQSWDDPPSKPMILVESASSLFICLLGPRSRRLFAYIFTPNQDTNIRTQ